MDRVNVFHRFNFHKNNTKHKTNGYTVAYKINNSTIELGVAFCSEQFNKAVGRKLAMQRLVDNPQRVTWNHICDTIILEKNKAIFDFVQNFFTENSWKIVRNDLADLLTNRFRILANIRKGFIDRFLAYYVKNNRNKLIKAFKEEPKKKYKTDNALINKCINELDLDFGEQVEITYNNKDWLKAIFIGVQYDSNNVVFMSRVDTDKERQKMVERWNPKDVRKRQNGNNKIS